MTFASPSCGVADGAPPTLNIVGGRGELIKSRSGNSGFSHVVSICRIDAKHRGCRHQPVADQVAFYGCFIKTAPPQLADMASVTSWVGRGYVRLSAFPVQRKLGLFVLMHEAVPRPTHRSQLSHNPHPCRFVPGPTATLIPPTCVLD